MFKRAEIESGTSDQSDGSQIALGFVWGPSVVLSKSQIEFAWDPLTRKI